MPQNKLMVIMIDGVSAEYFASCRSQLPHLDALASRGTLVQTLHSEVLGTSLPGRTSMMTGVTADVSGVYGNQIWDGSAFRYANPDDVRVMTVPGRAKAAGLDVAVMGFGMIRPEDATMMQAPWWATGFIQRARDAEPTAADQAWLRVAYQQKHPRLIAACEAAGIPTEFPPLDMENPANHAFFGLLADQTMLEWVGALAASADAPDLIITEYLSTDTIQHEAGYKSPLSHWSIQQADMVVGRVMERLRRAGTLDHWHFAIMSDHGHSAVETAIRTPVALPNSRVQCEGGTLLVAYDDATELAQITAKLAEYGAEPYPNDCIVPEYRDQIALFVSPAGMSFEDHYPADEAFGPAKTISTHGLKPGFSGDDRFAIFAGPSVPQDQIRSAHAVQVAPTLMQLLGLPTEDFPAAPILQRSRA